MYGIVDKKDVLIDYYLYQELKEGKTFDNIIWYFAKRLLDRYGPNYVIYADLLYGSWILAQKLHENDLYFCISAKKDKPTVLFKNYLHHKLDKGNWMSLTYKLIGITAITFHDNSKVNIFCNFVNVSKS